MKLVQFSQPSFHFNETKNTEHFRLEEFIFSPYINGSLKHRTCSVVSEKKSLDWKTDPVLQSLPYIECGFIVSHLHLTNIETACGEYIKILSGSYINPHKSYIRPKWVNDLSPICDLYLGLIFPTHISHLAHIGNTYPSYTEFLYGTNFPCLVGRLSNSRRSTGLDRLDPHIATKTQLRPWSRCGEQRSVY
jgi:hypothetical protein